MRERVLTWDVPGAVDAEVAFAALWGDAEHAFWLDTAAGSGGVSYLGAAAWAVDAEEIRLRGGDVLGWLRAERARWDVDCSGLDSGGASGGFALGIVGWLGYELYAETMGLGAMSPRRYPDALLMRVDRAIAVDHGSGRARLLARGTAWDGELAAWREHVLAALAAVSERESAPAPRVLPAGPGDPGGRFRRPTDLPTLQRRNEHGTSEHTGKADAAGPARPTAATAGIADSAVEWAYSDADYLEMVRACQHAIAEGDAYVLCLTTEARVDGAFDPWEVYRRVRRSSPSHHGAFLRSGPVALLSASPEQFLAVDRDGWVETKPIKGTRPRGATPAEDAALAAELRADEKERAENVMIVDLMRNDLSRVCEVGTVEVVRLLDVETYPHVHQLVSTVGGRLAPGRDAVHAVAACFPAGSMTGAPKHSAVSILSRLEARSRGIYSGAFGYFGYDGAVDLAMTIRSIVIDADGATVGTGGGITALSVPGDELAEARLKAAALLAALGEPPSGAGGA
ncbi:MAG: anthranilate synthase component I family protein [Microbacteriaceae bacterium]|nr:anthranilate synthase component I family protein [Microbacteriaceae bacterium]